MDIKLMDIVGRRSYHCDILFRVIDFREMNGQRFAILYGEDFRLVADAPCDDLVMINQKERVKLSQEFRNLEEQSYRLFSQDVDLLKERQAYEATNGYVKPSNYFQIPGKVLHLDGDPSYLNKCMALYEKIGVPVFGIHCNEKEMPNKIGEYIDLYRPDILVVTGHDAYSKAKGKMTDINAYRHSKHFVRPFWRPEGKYRSLTNSLFLRVPVNHTLNP